MKLAFLFLLLITTGSFASTAPHSNKVFDLQVRLSLGEKLIVVPNFSLPEKKIATFTRTVDKEKYYLTVTADEQQVTEDNRSLILFVFNIGKINPDGTKNLISNARIVTLEGEKAEITESDKAGHQVLSVSVLPTKSAK